MKKIFNRRNGTENPPPKPKLRFSQKVFGVSLIEVCKRENQPIPTVVVEVMAYIERRGVNLEGIFRIPGNSEYVQQLKEHYDGESDALTLDNCDDIHAVAGLLKQYIRELPDPLFTHKYYETFIIVQKNPDPNYRITNIRKLISALPDEHKYFLKELFRFLLLIAKNSARNKMTEPNLAIVFAPNLLRPQDDSMLKLIEDARYANGITKILLEEYDYLIACTSPVPKNPCYNTNINTTPNQQTFFGNLLELNLNNNNNYANNNNNNNNNTNNNNANNINGTLSNAPPKISEGLNGKSEPNKSVEPNHGSIMNRGGGGGGKRMAFKFTPNQSANTNNTATPNPNNPDRTPNPSFTPVKEIDLIIPLERKRPDLNASNYLDAEFDLSEPLQFSLQILSIARAESNRPEDINMMTPDQLLSEKVIVKRQLRIFDTTFKSKFSRLPTKKEKEPLRTLYNRYREISTLLEKQQQTTTTAATIKSPRAREKKTNLDTSSPRFEEYKKLKKEKRQLQIFLNQYQSDFLSKNNRKVQYAEDRIPIQKEYDRYKELKCKLLAIEEELAK